jgi:hypothetical protein
MQRKYPRKFPVCSLSFILLLGTFLTPLSIASFLTPPAMARQNQINLISRGSGVFNLQGRPERTVRSVSLNMRNNQQAEVKIVLDNNQTISFSGRAERQNSQRLRVNVRKSGSASANGTLLIEHNSNDILSLEGQGSLDSQSFSVTFRNQTGSLPPSSGNNSLNLMQRGTGLLNIQGRENRQISSVSVQVNNAGQATVSFNLSNGNPISFNGSQSHRDSTNLNISLSSSGSASASGFINIRYGANNSIINLVGDGSLDGQPFLVNFSQ